MRRFTLEVRADASEIYQGCQVAHQETLVAPLDDMWSAFADAASHYALVVNGETAGCCAVNKARELLFFYVETRFEHEAEALFRDLVESLEIVSACPSTVDPSFLSLSLEVGHGIEPKAMQFQHLMEPDGEALSALRLAQAVDHEAAVAFGEAATELPRGFLEPYLAERIERGELLLHEVQGEIRASGECRTDSRQPDYAHLGIIVRPNERGQGLGSQLMNALVLECGRRNLKPLCSTEPENLAARHVIHKAGFRARHRVFRVALGERD